MKRTTCVLIIVSWALCQSTASGQQCAWRPWAAPWSEIHTGTPLPAPNQDVYDPTNWDYSLSQPTVLNLPRDAAPGGGSNALHILFDAQTGTVVHGAGSGGFYQEITVTPGAPMQYSFYWKGKGGSQYNWFEFMLIDGPFSVLSADSGTTAPWIMRKREIANSQFGWEQLTDQSTGSPGPQATTITPTGSIVTVVLKAGHNPTGDNGGVEAFFDSVVVTQNNGPNLLVNGDFEDTAQQTPCDNQLMLQVPSEDEKQNNYWWPASDCPATVTGASPLNGVNNTDTTLTITGTDLESVTAVQLVPLAGGVTIDGTNLVYSPPTAATQLTADFPTASKADGQYQIVLIQNASPPCLKLAVEDPFVLQCPTTLVFSGMTPTSVTDPTSPTSLTISGEQLIKVTTPPGGAWLEYAGVPDTSYSINGLTMSGEDLTGQVDLTCAPTGSYNLRLRSNDSCTDKVADNAFTLTETLPAGACIWQPWAADWGHLNLGPDLDPPNEIYDPTNWDFTLGQHTYGNLMILDTPDNSSLALHWFLDSQPPDAGGGEGSGGVFQQITVQPGVPLEYSFYWKGAGGQGSSWFEFLLIDGPFSAYHADVLQENDEQRNNPAIVRKRTLSNSSFDWTQVTHTDQADSTPYGDRPTTITPSGTTATVVLKAGRSGMGSMESLWDNVVVLQSGGPNLIVNGDFESAGLAGICNRETIFADPCELNFWRRSTFVQLHCSIPFADADGDTDVDQADFALFQACFTGSGIFTLSTDCACFDRPEPIDPDSDVDLTDLLKFEACATGPGITASADCED